MKEKIFKLINNFLEKLIIPHDKSLHFIYGFFTFFFITFIFNPLYGLIFTILTSIFKETYDYIAPNHESSFMDALYTSIPALLSYILLIYK